MIRRAWMVAMMALGGLALPGAAAAQLFPLSFGIAGGPSTPVGGFADEAGSGFHAQGSLALSIPLLPVGARADVLWQQFPDEVGGSFTEVGGLINATVGIPLLVARPYLLAGTGIFYQREPGADHGDHAHTGGTSRVSAFAVGAGLEVSLLGLGGMVEARFIQAGDEHRSVPVSVGIRF